MAMAKRSSIGSLMRKKLSDITNSDHHHHLPPLDSFPSDQDCTIQQLLKEREALIQLLAERNKVMETNGAEVKKLRADIKKLQLQNWSLAQSNSHMLAELNLGRERIKTLQHELLWRAALLKGKTMEDVQEKVEIDAQKSASMSQSQVPKEEDEKVVQPPPKASNDEQHASMNRRRIRSRCKSIGSSTASTKNTTKDKDKDNRSLRRHSASFKTREHEPLENLFELEDAQYLVTQSGPNMLSSPAVKTETGESSVSRNETTRYSFGRPPRRAAEKVQSYKEVPLNVKMRRLQ
ncbi:shugoshin-1 [Lotus japonicus]|uniref:shugoshin-1 n=1 Tax=Lotus japonicus TaxID=34305 RepID=UPI0025890AD6|nr:shugoshin-1 [Lotus japonicus]